ncbi:MAG: hypothetical protein IPK80_17850 [Nannocystis sp.]|nr:hypothetical protein [Nannocystis sp.]
MNSPARRSPLDTSTYLVELLPSAVLGRLRADPRILVVPALPARTSSERRFLAALTPEGVQLCQNIGRSAMAGPPEVRRFFLEAAVSADPQGARVVCRFRPGPGPRQLRYWAVWLVCGLWPVVTGVTAGKVALVAMLVAITLPVLLIELYQARGTAAARLELLNLLEQLLGPAEIGSSAAEHTPYRDGHPPLSAPQEADDEEEEDEDADADADAGEDEVDEGRGGRVSRVSAF